MNRLIKIILGFPALLIGAIFWYILLVFDEEGFGMVLINTGKNFIKNPRINKPIIEDKTYAIYEYVAKYWYDTEYNELYKTNPEKCEQSREKFQKWISENLPQHPSNNNT